MHNKLKRKEKMRRLYIPVKLQRNSTFIPKIQSNLCKVVTLEAGLNCSLRADFRLYKKNQVSKLA